MTGHATCRRAPERTIGRIVFYSVPSISRSDATSIWSLLPIYRRRFLRGAGAFTLSPLMLQAGAARVAQDLTVGSLYVGSMNDFGNKQTHVQGAPTIKAMPGVTVLEEENIAESEAVSRSMQPMIELGGGPHLLLRRLPHKPGGARTRALPHGRRVELDQRLPLLRLGDAERRTYAGLRAGSLADGFVKSRSYGAMVSEAVRQQADSVGAEMAKGGYSVIRDR